MPRPKKDISQIKITLGASVLPEIDEEVQAIAIAEDRSKSWVAERLLLRGLKAFRQDGKLSVEEVAPIIARKINSGPLAKPSRRDRSDELINGAFGRHGQKASKKDKEAMRKSLEEDDDETPNE